MTSTKKTRLVAGTLPKISSEGLAYLKAIAEGMYRMQCMSMAAGQREKPEQKEKKGGAGLEKLGCMAIPAKKYL
jgi:hypothetical protein